MRKFIYYWAMLCIAMGAVITPVYAVDGDPPGLFELEGDAQDGAATGDDWSTLYTGGGGQTTYVFITDTGTSDNIFTGGGSKTPNDPGDWLWKTSPPPPDKDNVTHAYAANYMDGPDQIIYFGADLLADNGDAELAFWFFQSNVSAVAGGVFDGHHVNGDVYVAVKFSQGGTVATITVFEWDETCNKAEKVWDTGACAADNIRVKVPEAEAICDGSGSHVACAITNEEPEYSPWPYTPKSGTDHWFPVTTFFEGGINISAIFGAPMCFSSFMVTTGASTSFTSTAKDFALGEFDVCSVDVSKTCVNDSETDDAPDAITYDIRGCGINDGGALIYVSGLFNDIEGDVDEFDEPIGEYVPAVTWYQPGQVDDGGGLRDFTTGDCNDATLLKQAVQNGSVVDPVAASGLAGGNAFVYEFSETTDINTATDTVRLHAVGPGDYEIDDATDYAECPSRTFAASMLVTKQCQANLDIVNDYVVVRIDIQGMVCNTGEVPLTGLVLSDANPSGPPTTLLPAATTLAPQGDEGDCTDYVGFYYPTAYSTAESELGNLCPFPDTVEATAIAPENSAGFGDTSCEPTGSGTFLCTAESNQALCKLRVDDGDNDCSTGPLSPLP